MTEGTPVGPTVTRVYHEHLSGQRRPGPVQPLGFPHPLWVSAAYRALQAGQRAQRRRPAQSVGMNADVALKLAQRGVGRRAEDAVTSAEIEAHVQEPLLEVGDVVARERVADRMEQHAVTQPPPRLVQRAVGFRSDDAVRGEPTVLLERPDRAFTLLVVAARRGRRRRTGQVAE